MIRHVKYMSITYAYKNCVMNYVYTIALNIKDNDVIMLTIQVIEAYCMHLPNFSIHSGALCCRITLTYQYLKYSSFYLIIADNYADKVFSLLLAKLRPTELHFNQAGGVRGKKAASNYYAFIFKYPITNHFDSVAVWFMSKCTSAKYLVHFVPCTKENCLHFVTGTNSHKKFPLH
ncbi:hypothetical protein AGLY_007071 [Aphis glycines]|uniref:Uncharacterized protein n=1 Tax=Aphis glycines TaxID=307491 RepID=A0A6G0TQF9_APHGL|nr:hypothetical protein AGLY_007071 [Aphis glycines]